VVDRDAPWHERQPVKRLHQHFEGPSRALLRPAALQRVPAIHEEDPGGAKKANRGISNSLGLDQYRRKADPPGQTAGTVGTDYQKEPTALPENG